MAITLYSWRRKDPRTGRWRKLTWKMTEEDARGWARKETVEIEQVEGSAQERQPIGLMPSGTIPLASRKGATFFPAQSTDVIDEYFKQLDQRQRQDSGHKALP